MNLVVAWLQDWGTLSVAALALAQPWLWAAYRRFFRRPHIQAFPTSSIEVGFSQLGATIGLHGTLLAKGRDVFVYSIELEIVRQKDSATHDFVWALFRGFKAKASEFHDVEIYSETLSRIDRLRYWEPGRYSLTMRVITSDPDGSYDFEWEFDLNSTQEGLIKLNSTEMIQAACDQGTGNYRFAYADYETSNLPEVP